VSCLPWRRKLPVSNASREPTGLIDGFHSGTKWDVTYDPVEKLEKAEGTVLEQPGGAMELPEEVLRHMWSEFGIMAITREGLRNEEFPQIKPVTVREVVEAAWSERRST
jgi:hypothetical protein